MALGSNTHPHFTTIADFIATLDKEAIKLFREVLLTCDEMGLIGKEMIAIDGCKLPANASKEWSGTTKDFKNQAIPNFFIMPYLALWFSHSRTIRFRNFWKIVLILLTLIDVNLEVSEAVKSCAKYLKISLNFRSDILLHF